MQRLQVLGTWGAEMQDTNGTPFIASEFRSVIKTTMRMGIPEAPEERLIWHFNPVKAYSPQDAALKPYDYSTPPVLDQPSDPDNPDGSKVVDYALEFASGTSLEADIGRFDTSRAVVTLLDVDYEEIRNADYAMIGRTYYEIKFVGPPLGMFDVTVYQVYLNARDQA